MEDKLGREYEPYIFAALNSAKVMLVVGSKAEYFSAVWVKNEWSRFLKLMKTDRKKLLIPCYRDIDAYELPEEFAHLQAQDMGKIGFINDLVRGIKKVVADNTPKTAAKETVVVSSNNASTAPLLERAFLFLEDGKWQDANIYCEKVLDIDPKNAEAYLGKLMAELQVRNRKKLADLKEPFDNKDNCQKAIRFGDEELKKFLDNCNKEIVYNNAQSSMRNAQSEEAFKKAAIIFQSINGFQDADALAEQCLTNAEICRKDEIYSLAKARISRSTIPTIEAAIRQFQSISGWKDADEQVYACQRKIEEIKAKEEADRLEAERKAEAKRIADEKAAKKRKKIIAITTPIICTCIAFIIVLTTVIIPSGKYNYAMELYNAGKYQDAYTAFNEVSYKDSNDKASECLFLVQKANLSDVKKGDTVKFGFYEQDNNATNGKEEIEWTVLNVEGNKALVISKYALDCRKYNTSSTDTTWEECTLRTWLNDSFLNEAFGTKWQELIPSVSVSADKNPEYSTNPGNATTDKVFLLSITEAEKYFTSDEDRKCVPTAYAIAQGAYTSSSYTKGTCWWWLRSPGYDQGRAAYVDYFGSVYYTGSYVDHVRVCVRPALWINLDS